MARVTSDEVKEIMDGCNLSTAEIEVYINAANVFINSIFGLTNPVDDSSSDTVSETNLYFEIERWLTAHMIASTKFRTTTEEQINDAKIVFTGKFGMGLDSTPYGQMVKMLDITGTLATADKKKASIFAIPQFKD